MPPPVIGFANSIRLLPIDQLSIDHSHSFFLKLLQTPSPHGVDVSLYDSIAFPRMHIIQIVPFPLLPLLLLLLGRSKSFVVYYTTSSRARALTTQWVVLTIKRIWNVSSMCFLQKAKLMLSQTLLTSILDYLDAFTFFDLFRFSKISRHSIKVRSETFWQDYKVLWFLQNVFCPNGRVSHRSKASYWMSNHILAIFPSWEFFIAFKQFSR